jgi:ornithine cyclodeaminase
MDLRILSRADVERLLPMARALEATSRGDAILPLRSMMPVPDHRGMIGVMPGYLGEPRGFGLKVVSVFPGNHGTALDSHQGVVMLFDPDAGSPLAVIDAGSVTAIRTAAVSGVATRALARDDAADLAIRRPRASSSIARSRPAPGWSCRSCRRS